MLYSKSQLGLSLYTPAMMRINDKEKTVEVKSFENGLHILGWPFEANQFQEKSSY